MHERTRACACMRSLTHSLNPVSFVQSERSHDAGQCRLKSRRADVLLIRLALDPRRNALRNWQRLAVSTAAS
eukprot:4107336-Alexandrium_andersonii.AAC.1